MDELLRTEHRCECGRFLFRGLILKDEVEMKCPRCKKVHYFSGLGVAGRAKLFAVLTEPGGTIVNASASVKAVFGKSISQLVGTPVSALFASEKDAASDGAIAKLAPKHKYLRLDARIITEQSDRRAVTVSYAPVARRDESFVLRSVRHSSGAEDGELNALNFSRSDMCPFICEADGNGVIQYVSDTIEELFGYRPEETVGHHVNEFTAPEDLERRAMNRNFFAKRELTYRQRDHMLLAKGGKRLLCEIHATPLHDHTGEFVGYKNIIWPQ